MLFSLAYIKSPMENALRDNLGQESWAQALISEISYYG